MPTSSALAALVWSKLMHSTGSPPGATLLRGNLVHFYNPGRIRGIWALRPLLREGDLAASFEEMIYIDGDDRRVLGRGDISEIGTL